MAFFYCGCAACHASARLWRQIEDSEARPPVTVIVFSGDAAEARQFDAQTGLDAAHAVTLIDAQDHVTDLYHVTVCPRVFVLDAQGRITYTNNAPGTDPQTTPALVLDSQALTAWRKTPRNPVTHHTMTHHPASLVPRSAGSSRSGRIWRSSQGNMSPQGNVSLQGDVMLALLILPLREDPVSAANKVVGKVVGPPSLTVIPNPAGGVARAADGAGVWEAGAVDPMQHPTIVQTFTLRNTTAAPITVASMRAACGCTSLLADHTLPETLKPGQQTQVRVTLRMTGQPATTLHKYAWLYAPGAAAGATGAAPLATLAINVTVRPAAALSPAFVDFGTVAQGTAHGQTVTVTVDKAALTQQPFPLLVCTNQNVSVTPQGAPRPTTRDGLPALTQTFAVTLTDHAPAGPILGRLLLRGAADAPPASGNPLLPLFDVSGDLGGRVTGDLTATPPSMFFGSLPAGRDTTRQALITAATPAAAASLTVTSSSHWLIARLLPSVPGQPTTRLLAVTLSHAAPPGSFAAQITLQDASGQHLSLPVLADLTP